MAFENQGYYRKVIKEKNDADERYTEAMEYFDENGDCNWNKDFIDMAYNFEAAFIKCSESETSLEHLLKNQTLIKEQHKYENMLKDIRNKKSEVISSYSSIKNKYISGACGLSDAEQRT